MSIYARVFYHVAHDKVGKQDNKKYSVQFSSCDTHIRKPKDNLCCCRFCATKLGSKIIRYFEPKKKIIRYTVLYLTSLANVLASWEYEIEHRQIRSMNLDSLEMNFILRLINYGIWFLYI